jgi:hypothetical protein
LISVNDGIENAIASGFGGLNAMTKTLFKKDRSIFVKKGKAFNFLVCL